MLSYDEMHYHPNSEQLVQILCDKTESDNELFFRVMVAYYFCVVAAQMRTTIATPDRGDIPVNMYAINLAPSGTGKGHSTNIIEEHAIGQFRHRFVDETFPLLAERNLPKLAVKRAIRKKLTNDDEELARVQKEFEGLGELAFSFDSGTPPAIKQMRHKLLMAEAGSVNLQIDEIGSNLLSANEVLVTMLELYDKGLIKQKLTKNTHENTRTEEIRGATPTNMLLFGTPASLLNGSKTEEEFYAMLETGYARRCLFGYARKTNKRTGKSPDEILDMMMNPSTNQFLQDLSDKLERLADIINANKRLVMVRDTARLMIEYKTKCEVEAEKLPDHNEIRRAELSHRYFKALKLAGAYAFIDDSPELTEAHLYNAIKLVEDSGKAFENLLTRDRNYVKLAKYISSVGRDVTQPDLVEDLPFYKGGNAAKNEMMQLAIAWGYKNNIIVKKSFQDGIEFLRGESLKETDLDKMAIAYSDNMTTGYQNEAQPFDQLHKLVQATGYHWTSHHLKGGYRNEENAIPGFNLLVVDVDAGVNLDTARLLLQDFKALYYTTKSHTPQNQRFRILLPLNYELQLDAKDYKEFMHNVFEWLPFGVDESGSHRCKKWLAHAGHYEYNDGVLFDALPFIPKTSKNEERRTLLNSQQSLDNLERWVINTTGDGNRNNQLLKYAYILVDAGFDFQSVSTRVKELNDKLPDKLEEIELSSTILITVAKAIAKRP